MKTWLAASSTSASPARKRRAAVCTALRTTRRYSRAKRSHAGRPPASSSRTASLPSAISPPDAREFYRLPTASGCKVVRFEGLSMRTLLCLLALSFLQDDLLPLFNGKDLSGWEAVGGSVDCWAWEDGKVVCKGGKGG